MRGRLIASNHVTYMRPHLHIQQYMPHTVQSVSLASSPPGKRQERPSMSGLVPASRKWPPPKAEFFKRSAVKEDAEGSIPLRMLNSPHRTSHGLSWSSRNNDILRIRPKQQRAWRINSLTSQSPLMRFPNNHQHQRL